MTNPLEMGCSSWDILRQKPSGPWFPLTLQLDDPLYLTIYPRISEKYPVHQLSVSVTKYSGRKACFRSGFQLPTLLRARESTVHPRSSWGGGMFTSGLLGSKRWREWGWGLHAHKGINSLTFSHWVWSLKKAGNQTFQDVDLWGIVKIQTWAISFPWQSTYN